MPPDDAVNVGEDQGRVARVAAVTGAIALLTSAAIPGLWYMGVAAPLPFRTTLFWLMTAFVSLIALGLLVALRVAGRELPSALVLTAVVVLITFSWPVLTSIGGDVAARLNIGLVGDVSPVVIGGSAVWISARLTRESAFAVVIGATVVGYGIVLVSTVLPLVVRGPDPVVAHEPDPSAPDVLLLVLDAYGRSDVLAERFDTDTSGFLDALEALGFFVADDATANYPFTYAAVSTMLDADYTIDDGPISDEELEAVRSALSGHSGMVREFAAAGYETRYLLNAWAGSHCGHLVDVCVSGGIVGRSLWNLGRMTILSPLIDAVWRNPLNNQSVDHLTALADILATGSRDGRPVFTFAHIILPHVPFRLSADCTRTAGGAASEWGSQPGLRAERLERFRAQITCVNTLLVEALEPYVGEHPDAVVVITADHGPGASLNPNHSANTVPAPALAERIPILSAYRFPGCENLYRSDLTPVNGARAVLRCALGADVAPLDDITRWVDFDAEGVATDITERIRPSP